MRKELQTKLEAIGPKRFILFRAFQLGDLMVTIPAVHGLRNALPEAVINLMGLPWAEGFTRRFSSYFDDFIEFPLELKKTGIRQRGNYGSLFADAA